MYSDHRPGKAASHAGIHDFLMPAAAGTPPARHDLRQIGRQNYRQVVGSFLGSYRERKPMFNFSYFTGRAAPRAQTTPSFDFGRLLNWKILRGSHEFPGPDGGTCVNEAAIVAAGYPYKPVRRIDDCPLTFSRPMALYAMCLNEIILGDGLRQELLMPFVTRLAGSADTQQVEMQRMALIIQRTVATILPEAFRRTGYGWEAQHCRSAETVEDAVAAVRCFGERNWFGRGPHMIGMVNTIS